MRNAIASEKKNIKGGALLAYISLFISIVLHIFYTPYLLQKVGDTQYGLWSFVTSITSWFTIGAYALNDSFIKFSTSEKAEKGSNGRSNTIYLKLMLSLAAVICAVGLVLFVLLWKGIIPLNKYTDEEKNTIYVLYLISLTQIIITTVLAFFRLYNEYRSNFISVKVITLLNTLLNFGISFWVLQKAPSIVNIAIVGWLVSFATLSLYYIIAKYRLGIEFGNDKLVHNKSYVKQIFGFSFYLLLSVIVTEVNTSVDKTILGFLAGATYVTSYQLGLTFDTYFAEFATSVNSVFIPRINKLVVNNKKQDVDSLFLKLSRLQSAIVFLIIGGFTVSGRDFIAAWLKRSDNTIYVVALCLMMLHSVHYCAYSSQTIQRAYSKHKIPALINVFVAAFNVLLSVILVNICSIEKSIYMCLIGTAIAEIIGKWIIIPQYNSTVIGLPIKKFFKQIGIYVLIFALCSMSSMAIFKMINRSVVISSYWLSFAVKGFIYLVIYMAVIIPMNRDLFQSFFRKSD